MTFPSWLTLLFMLLLSGVLVSLAGMLLIALSLLRPPRMTDGKALAVLRRLGPLDLGLDYQPTEFEVRNERDGKPISVAAWHIPAKTPSPKSVVFIHGYADAKVGSIAWAPTWHRLGWNVLAMDLRAHGESGGTETTGGYYERHDVSQVINAFRGRHPEQTERLALFGVSMGAAVAVATAADRDDLDALALDSPITDYRVAVTSHGRLIGSAMFLMPAAIRLAEWIGHADFDAVRPLDLLAKVKAPIFTIVSGRDALISPAERAAFAEAIAARGRPALDRIWQVDAAEHLQAQGCEPQQYGESLRLWLESVGLG